MPIGSVCVCLGLFMGQWLSDDFEGKFNLIYCDSDLAKSHCGDDCPDHGIYIYPQILLCLHSATWDSIGWIWNDRNMEYGVYPFPMVWYCRGCVCVWCFILTYHLLRRTVRRESLKHQGFKLSALIPAWAAGFHGDCRWERCRPNLNYWSRVSLA